MNHIVFFSGGASSYVTAKRVIAKYGAENVVLLFTDTNSEEPALYDFIIKAKDKLGCELKWIDNDGKNIWDVAFEQKMIFTSRLANCTKELKIYPAEKYIKESFSPEDTILYLGLDWEEMHRQGAPRANWRPYQVEYPMNEVPFYFKEDYLAEIEKDGLPLLEGYKQGFSHGNCSSFCFKAGIGHFVHLLKTNPEAYFENAEKERQLQEVIREHRKEVLPARINKEKNKKKRKGLIRMLNTLDQQSPTILTRTVGKRFVNLSLYDLADLYAKSDISILKTHLRYRNKLKHSEAKPVEQEVLTQEELFSFGGCGCFSSANKEKNAELFA